MEKKYLELKAKALERMAEDFLWVINHEYTERLQWTAETSLLVEFVHDVSSYLHPQDELFRRIPLYRLYADFSRAVGVSLPKQPAVSLSKLRTREMRKNISPDTIIRFYMKQIEKEQAGASPNRDIILCLLQMV